MSTTALPAVLDEIASLSELQAGWDSYGAAKIEQAAITTAAGVAKLLVGLGCRPHVAPTPNGEVLLSVDHAAGGTELRCGTGGEVLAVVFDKHDNATSGLIFQLNHEE